ncbi:glutaredoxin domain-containing protein [Branchiibius cervicis]|uniref:Glutaredoxin domain-containing protein n=1 Tax=Branchiibius cervicis TaxID=908252 RepID=A0ABW2AQR0_9MICO
MSDVTIYWRPGCGFCARLEDTISAVRERATWRNIWEDDEAAAFVRSVNNGNEVVPTVVVDGQAHTNPDPGLVLAALADS